nr:putative RNA-dependent RNA polymerase [Binucleate Rhizoctonia mitovirus 5]
MKRIKFSIFRYFGRLNLCLNNFNAIFSVKAKGSGIDILRSLFILAAIRLTPRRLRISFFLFRALCAIYRAQGSPGLIKFLKTASVALQQYLGHNVLDDVGNIGQVRISRTNSGIPRILHPEIRKSLREGDPRFIRFVLSVFNFYRNFQMEGKPKLSTITASNRGDMEVMPMLIGYIRPFLQSFVFSRFDRAAIKAILTKNGGIFPIYKSAPGMIKENLPMGGVSDYSSHPVNLISQLRALIDKGLIEHINVLIEKWGNVNLRYFIDASKPLFAGPVRGTLGKLSVKEEAAGKVRVFAIVDAWSQWALNPLHALIFDFLREVPMDGTFDQLKPLSRLDQTKSLYSLDLTAATDRLPIVLQKELLIGLFDKDCATAWAALLVDRNYGFHALGYDKYHGQYRYAVGQPMGALSSWAMLALTHHFLVQAAAWMSGRVPVGTLYTNYAVLGDDLVIGDGGVKDCYLYILKSLGMEVNIHKSIISDRGTALEFAKRTFYKGMDVSPFPLSELGAAQTFLPALIQYKEKYNLSLVELLRVFGFGWRNLSHLTKPLGSLSAQIRAIILADAIPNTAAEARDFFLLGTPRHSKYTVDMNQLKAMFMLGDITVTARSVERQGLFAKDFLFGLADKLSYTLAQVMLWVDANVLSIDRHIGAPKDFSSFVPSEPKIAAFNTLWRGLLGPSIGKIFQISLKINQKFPAWKVQFDPWMRQAEFYELYFEYLEALREISLMGNHVFELRRPEGLEGISTNPNKVTPQQIRFYRKWSGVIQGAVPLEHIQVSSGALHRRSRKAR